MNPRAGDTVTSTKSSTTNTKTTGARATVGGRRAAARGTPTRATATTTASRKRRQQPEPPPPPPARPRPEANPPPDKLQRRHDTPAAGAAHHHKSRFGDFFSSLASRFRGSRTQDAPSDHEDTEKHVKSNAAESLEHVEETVKSMQSPVNSENKRRKIEPSAEGDKISSDDSTVTLIDNLDAEEPDLRRNEPESMQNSTDCASRNDSGANATGAEQASDSNGAAQRDGQRLEVEQACKNFLEDICREAWGCEERSKAAADMSEDAEPEERGQLPAEKSSEEAISVTPAEEDKLSRESRCSRSQRKDEVARLRKTIQWLEENARRLREELAEVRSELHEERRASKLARREYEAAMRETRHTEATKYGAIIGDLKARLSQSPSRSTVDSSPSSSKTDLLKSENHRREVAALKKRLATAETMIQKLKSNSLDRDRTNRSNKENESNRGGSSEVRKLQLEINSLRAVNKSLEEKLRIAEESARARAAELRTQHENHEAQMSSLQKVLRSDTIKMIDEIQSKNRIIEKLEKMASECAQVNEKLRAKEDETMRKLRESERSHQIRLSHRIEEKIHHDDHVVDLCKVDCEDDDAATELDRLRELAIEQQEVIEVLRQAVKEKERKLEQLSNKRRKEEFYKQWLELEPVAEVEDEDEHQHEEGDSALSSAPPSLSPQPGNGGFGATVSGVTREAYDNLLFEIEELQTKLLEEQQELTHAKTQVRDLEKALLQETRGSQNSRRALTEKLRMAEEREASLIAEISELREQNELLEFRVLELEESPNPRDTPDPADSGIVSPEPIHLYKEHQASKHRDRAVATVMPYTSTYSQPITCESHDQAHEPQKASLSLEESGIFEEEVEADETDSAAGSSTRSQPPSEATQTEAPAGELLQEVQRLQELRARIQERGAKIPPLSPTSDRRGELEATPVDPDLVGELRERVRQLEELISAREAERREAKAREEELLDENYRLTEHTFCLEADLKALRERMDQVRLTSDAGTMTEAAATPRCRREAADDEAQRSEYVSESQPCPECSELWKDCDARIRQLARTEFCLRQQIASLEQREGAFFETLRQADASWASLEAGYEAKLRETADRLAGQIELNRALFEHLTRLNRTADDTYDPPKEADKSPPAEAMEVDDHAPPAARPERATQTEAPEECACRGQSPGVLVRTPAEADSRTGTISRTRIKVTEADGRDEIDMKVLTTEAAEPPTEVATEATEKLVPPVGGEGGAAAENQTEEDQTEALVSIDRASSDKKVSRLRGSLRRLVAARGSDALSQWSERRKAVSFERNVIGPAQRTHRLTIYKEICV